MTDTSPKRLRELADAMLTKCSIGGIYDILLALASEKENPAPICPTCGSDCNERDELEKAEREIERLRGLLAEKEAQHHIADTCEVAKPDEVPLPEATVPWPTVARYTGGASHEGLGGRVWLRLKDEGPDVEYMPVSAAVEQVADVPLPEPDCASDFHAHTKAYTADFVRQYGQACAQAARDAERERCYELVAEEQFYPSSAGFAVVNEVCHRAMDRIRDGVTLADLQAATKGTT